VDLLATQLVLWFLWRERILKANFQLPKLNNAKIMYMTPFAATKQMVGQMVGGVLLLVNLGLKLYSELKQTVIKNRIDSCLVKRFCWHLAEGQLAFSTVFF